MKRSKAISVIANLLYELGVEPEDTDKEADELLTALEKEGMIPPSTDYFIKNKPEGFELHWEPINDYHQWEPEE